MWFFLREAQDPFSSWRGAKKEELMFEETQSGKETGSNRLWIGLFVIAAVAGLGAWLYTMSRGGTKETTPASSAAVSANADPVHDLRVLRTIMEKDALGTTAVWLVTIQNK